MSHFDDYSFDSVDFLLLAGGSDHRAYQILRLCHGKGIKIQRVLIFNFSERVDGTPSTDVYYDYKNIPYEVTLINCSIVDPVSCLAELQKNLTGIAEENQIAIDISCFTKPYFFYVLKYLRERHLIRTALAFYTEPSSYRFPKKGLFNSYHEAEGPVSIKEIPGFNGTRPRTGTSVLVVQLGFESISLEEIIIDVSPNEMFLVNGFPSYAPKFKDISLSINEAYTANKDNIILYSSSNNPFEVFNLLEKLKKNFQNGFLNIAPLGTKPMALGACMFAILNPDVKVVFPFSEKYEKVTTDQYWNSWVYEIPFQ